MKSLASFSLLLALAVSVHGTSFRDSSPREPEGPIDAPGPVGIQTLPAKLPDDWPRPVATDSGAAGKQRREATDSKTENRPLIKPQPAQRLPEAPNRQPARPTRESTTPRPGQKPQSPNQQKPGTFPAHTGLNGNRQGLTKPAPTPAKPAQSNTQKPHTQPAQTGLGGNRQGLTKPAHARTQRHASDDEPKPQPLPAIVGTQKPQVLPAPIDNERPLTAIPDGGGERPSFRPPPALPLRPMTIPAYVGSTERPRPLPATIDSLPSFLVDPVPPHLAKPSPADRPERETSLSSTSSEDNKPQTLPALVSPPKPQTPQTLPPVGTQPVLTGNRDSLLRPAPLPAHSGSS
ncbi:extensin-like [Ischnura elegans]|uniref:extensin-like n=1 Tax=Ischnura elegans TaxID=197161 RepID=UPI001ED87A00|nr:extensin-like [Ischnura elegans]